jgi:hypothetical protein
VHVRDAVDPKIGFSMEFLGWEAAVSAGATLDELQAWDEGTGRYSKHFKARVIAWYQYHSLVRTHQEDAARPKRKGK